MKRHNLRMLTYLIKWLITKIVDYLCSGTHNCIPFLNSVCEFVSSQS